MKNNIKIAVIGLGYVGLPLAIAFSKKFRVVGFDVNKLIINQLKNSVDLTNEIKNKKDLQNKNILFTNNIIKMKNANIFIITVLDCFKFIISSHCIKRLFNISKYNIASF